MKSDENSRSTLIELQVDGFAPEYSCQVLPTAPTDVHLIDFRWNPGLPTARGLCLTIRPDSASAWTGRFWGLSPYYPTFVHACPSPTRLLVVVEGRGYYVNVVDPCSATCFPGLVTGALPSADGGRLFVWNTQDLFAIDERGIEWWIERLAEEGLQIMSASADLVRGVRRDPVPDADEEFELRLTELADPAGDTLSKQLRYARIHMGGEGLW